MMHNNEMPELLEDDPTHSLLEPPTPAYTSVTVRRAFIVWFYCNQKNDFKQVCNYFHYLESLEDKMSPKARAASRLHELKLLTSLPPASNYLQYSFPGLYRQNKYSTFNFNMERNELRFEDSIFGFEGYYDLKIEKGTSTRDLLKISVMIRNYCKVHGLTLHYFFEIFLYFVKTTKTEKTVLNLFVFISNMYIRDELKTHKSMPKDFVFLNDHVSDIEDSDDDYNIFNADVKSPNEILMSIKESRKEEFMHWLPQLSVYPSREMEPKNGQCSKSSNENFISTKILETRMETADDELDLANMI